MRAKSVDFKVTYINLHEKPDWFLKISPHGKVPVLLVDDQPLFESSAIAEFLDEVIEPKLHPQDPFERAKHRAWTDYTPTFSGLLGGVYYSKSAAAVAPAKDQARVGLAKLESALRIFQPAGSRFFCGDHLCLVDAAYAPFFQRYQFVEDALNTGLLAEFPRVSAWAKALLDEDIVRGSVASNFADEYASGLKRRGAYAAQYFKAA